MMNVLNIVFKFFDCFVIIGLMFYVIKQYLIPMVEKLLREYGVFIYNLESDCKNLQSQTQSIHENIQDQDRQFQAIQLRFLTWQKKCDERVGAQKVEQLRIDSAMHQRFIIRSQYVKNDSALQEQLPAILVHATKALQRKYYEVDEQRKYIDELIHVMKDRS